MAHSLMTPPAAEPRSASTAAHPQRSVREIITAARHRPASWRSAWLLSAVTGVLLWASFTPLDWGWIAWIALVPLLLLVRIERPTMWMYAAVYLNGLGFSLVTLQWMRLGDPSMYVALAALSIYMGLYFPAFVGLSRIAVRRYALPLTLAAPVIWVGLEFLRAHLMTGFAWYFLGHTQHRWIELIQISDLVGAYGVSFVVMLGNAAVAGLIPSSWLVRLGLIPMDERASAARYDAPFRRRVQAAVVSVGVVAAVVGYGYVRRSQAEFTAGPRVALIQGNFTSSIKHDESAWGNMYRTHTYLTGLSVLHQPEIVIWPETMFRHPLKRPAPGMTDEQLQAVNPLIPAEWWRDGQTQDALFDLSEQCNAALIFGIDAFEAAPGRFAHYNSAVFVEPGRGITGRYDKIHRVPFGEYVPLRDQLPWLQKLTPYGDTAGLQAGREFDIFEYEQCRLAPLICFEDTVPHFVRNFVASAEKDGRKVDCLVNLTNDGWFHGSSELNQHLITAAFRCVETRTPMVRAVNTGISAFIDGDGVVREPDVFIDGDAKLRHGSAAADPETARAPRTSMRDPQTGRYHKQLNAALVSDVPLDNRRSAYVAGGDWFAGSCAVGCLALLFGSLLRRRPKVFSRDV